MKRPNMLGFYRKSCFVDCVEVWCWLIAGGGVFLFASCMCVVGVFKVCGLQGTRKRWYLWLVDWD